MPATLCKTGITGACSLVFFVGLSVQKLKKLMIIKIDVNWYNMFYGEL